MKPKSKIEVVTFPDNGIKPKAPSADLRSAAGRVLLGKYAAQDVLTVCTAALLHADRLDAAAKAKETSPLGAGKLIGTNEPRATAGVPRRSPIASRPKPLA